jgi:LAS superfamily LD-carboxypeptidase LdcB
MLTPQQLTGRIATHVRHVDELRCTLHEGAAKSLLALRAAARQAGIEIAVVSGFRDFEHQAAIWNAKFQGQRPLLDRDGRALDSTGLSEPALIEAILQWSALPGASRHHWGSDLDVIDTAAMPIDYRPKLTAQEFGECGVFAKLDDWLTTNIARFDFFRPYDSDHGGVLPEAWHLSYAPVSVPALQNLTLEVLVETIAASSLCGAKTVLERLPQIYGRYVRAIDSP